MKKIIPVVALIISILIFTFFDVTTDVVTSPGSYYKVYLDGNEMGTINSKDELENYINNKGNDIKKKLDTNKVYSPNGLEIVKISTFEQDIDSVSTVYKKIEKEKPFTVKGYEFAIKKDDKKIIVHTLDKEIFKEAIDKTIESFVGTDTYESYINKNQKEIKTTGTRIENIYVSNNITVKESNISTDKRIYTDVDELSRFLLFGKDMKEKTYTVLSNDTVEKIAFSNQISPEELVITNSELKSSSSLLYEGQKLNIAYLNPQVTVVVEAFSVQDVESKYKTEERYDDDRVVGNDQVIQNGQNGLERVSQNIKYENGTMVYVVPTNKEELKPSVNEIVIVGQKVVPEVGTLKNWAWPTNSGYIITSGYGYRIHPLSGARDLHDALDIATGYGSPIYAGNNGVVVTARYHYSYGNHIVINHNNGYYTLYAHMSTLNTKVGAVVEKGQHIGAMGMTGSASGPHLHYEVWVGGPPHGGGTNINPYSVY